LQVEWVIYPAVVALTFVLAGYAIAPSRKFATAVVLACLFAILDIVFWLNVVRSGLPVHAEARAVGPPAGLLLALFLAWRKSKARPA
jgi:hypothetical protein